MHAYMICYIYNQSSWRHANYNTWLSRIPERPRHPPGRRYLKRLQESCKTGLRRRFAITMSYAPSLMDISSLLLLLGARTTSRDSDPNPLSEAFCFADVTAIGSMSTPTAWLAPSYEIKKRMKKLITVNLEKRTKEINIWIYKNASFSPSVLKWPESQSQSHNPKHFPHPSQLVSTIEGITE